MPRPNGNRPSWVIFSPVGVPPRQVAYQPRPTGCSKPRRGPSSSTCARETTCACEASGDAILNVGLPVSSGRSIKIVRFDWPCAHWLGKSLSEIGRTLGQQGDWPGEMGIYDQSEHVCSLQPVCCLTPRYPRSNGCEKLTYPTYLGNCLRDRPHRFGFPITAALGWTGRLALFVGARSYRIDGRQSLNSPPCQYP